MKEFHRQAEEIRQCCNMPNLLAAWLGQRMQDGLAYRPIQKRIRHILSEEAVREFLELAQKEWEGKGLEGQEKYFVRLGMQQFADDRANGGDAGAVVLVDADHIVFYL